jgi:N-acetylglucosamine malate deacetylase 2
VRILAVYAHPDDEAFGPSDILARYARAGAEVAGVWATRGEHGEAPVEPAPDPATLGALREQDLRAAAAVIGIGRVELLGYEDNALEQVPPAELEERVLAVMRAVRPEVVLTMGPAGITRHPDHVALHRATVAAFHRARAEGAAVRELYFDAVRPEAARDLGLEAEPDGRPNTWIEVRDTLPVKQEALRLHGRHVLDAKERAARLEEAGPPVETRSPLYRAWPPVPPGVVVRELLGGC